MHQRHSRRLAAILAMVLALSVVALPAAAEGNVSEPIATGLLGPLGLAVGADGTIYVAEAFGGILTTIGRDGSRSEFVNLAGSEIAGVDADGRGHVVFTSTLFDGAAGEEAPPLDAVLDRVTAGGKLRLVTSTNDYEAAANPDGSQTYGVVDPSPACEAAWPDFLGPMSYTGIVESHPYAVAIVPGGYVVADAAANAILDVRANGRVSTLAVLPPIAQTITQDVLDEFGLAGLLDDCVGETLLGEPVPTDVEVGPDGAYYVSTLPGGLETPGAGAVWRIDPRTGGLTLVTDGLVTPVDIAVAPDGSIYVAELFAGDIVKIDGEGISKVADVSLPGAIEYGPDGLLYVTVDALGPSGSLVTVTP